MKTRLMIAACLVAATAGVGAYADENKKFCGTLAQFDSDVAALNAIGPQSTVGELRAARDRVDKDESQLKWEARWMNTPAAKEFRDALKQLDNDVNSLPNNGTLQQTGSKIQADAQNLQSAGRKLAGEAGCPELAPQR